MNKLLAWAVLTLAILAGFTARADDNNPVIIVKKSNGVVKCQIYSSFSSGDSRLSAREFGSHKECEESAAFEYFNGGKAVKKPKPVPKPVVKLSKIDKYVKIFESKTGIPASHIKFRLGKTGKGAVGTCSMKKRTIVINKEYWEGDTSEYDKELTIYHELGHCLLNRDHYNPKNWTFNSPSLQKKCPVSIMYWKGYGAKDAYRCFHEHRAYYWKELVSGTLAVKATKEGVKKDLFDYYLSPGSKKYKVGSFSCSVYISKKQPKYYPEFKQVWVYASLSCSRDRVMFTRNFRFFVTAVGNDAINNLKTKALNEHPLRLILNDTLLKETFTIIVYKESNDLW